MYKARPTARISSFCISPENQSATYLRFSVIWPLLKRMVALRLHPNAKRCAGRKVFFNLSEIVPVVDGSGSRGCRIFGTLRAGKGLLPQPPPARAPVRSAIVSGSAIGTTKGIVTINPTGNLGSTGRAITVSVRFAHDLYIFRNGRVHDRICLI
jgi:hypothetical protein